MGIAMGGMNMGIKAVLFDLDGTLLPLDQDIFTENYIKLLVKWHMPLNYDPQKLAENVWAATVAMVKNDGRRTNETVFWEHFEGAYGPRTAEDREFVNQFYKNDFLKLKAVCGFEKAAKEIVEELKERGKTLVLATNPFFPELAVKTRVEWAGLSTEDFALCTTYENSCFCKPNPQYYLDIAHRIGVLPEECLMVGNDVQEDMIARETGMQVFLLTDHLLNKKNLDTASYPKGGFAELREYLKTI